MARKEKQYYRPPYVCASHTRLIAFNPLSATTENGQTHSNNSPALGDEYFECI